MDNRDALALVATRRALRDGTARKLRQDAGLSQIEVGRTCRVTTQAVGKWEAGQRVPRGEPALRYAHLLVSLGLPVTDGDTSTDPDGVGSQPEYA